MKTKDFVTYDEELIERVYEKLPSILGIILESSTTCFTFFEDAKKEIHGLIEKAESFDNADPETKKFNISIYKDLFNDFRAMENKLANVHKKIEKLAE